MAPFCRRLRVCVRAFRKGMSAERREDVDVDADRLTFDAVEEARSAEREAEDASPLSLPETSARLRRSSFFGEAPGEAGDGDTVACPEALLGAKSCK